VPSGLHRRRMFCPCGPPVCLFIGKVGLPGLPPVSRGAPSVSESYIGLRGKSCTGRRSLSSLTRLAHSLSRSSCNLCAEYSFISLHQGRRRASQRATGEGQGVPPWHGQLGAEGPGQDVVAKRARSRHRSAPTRCAWCVARAQEGTFVPQYQVATGRLPAWRPWPRVLRELAARSGHPDVSLS
jgi:hypothetical protein